MENLNIKDNSNIKEIVISSSRKDFTMNIQNVEKITIKADNVTIVNDSTTFTDKYNNLKNLTFNKDAKVVIEAGAIRNCPNLEEIKLPGDAEFEGACINTGLKKISFVGESQYKTIRMTSIQSRNFYSCQKEKSVTIEADKRNRKLHTPRIKSLVTKNMEKKGTGHFMEPTA